MKIIRRAFGPLGPCPLCKRELHEYNGTRECRSCGWDEDAPGGARETVIAALRKIA